MIFISEYMGTLFINLGVHTLITFNDIYTPQLSINNSYVELKN